MATPYSTPAAPDYPIGPREAERIAALAATGLLDTLPESHYDDIVTLAALLCDTPLATVTLLDRDRQWFKAKVGTTVQETTRSVAFCNYPVAERRTCVVPDATLDPRFAANVLVTGEPHLRFYAGAPLLTPDGHALGTLCVLDTKPRTLPAEQIRALEALARQVVRAIQMRENLRELHAAKEEAQNASASKSQFLANMSHEIRTPLTAILGYADLLEDTESAPGERRAFIETIRRNGRHLLTLINDILDLSKIEAERVQLEQVATPLAPLISECVNLIRPRADAKKIPLSIEYTTAAPDAILTDPTRLRQVLTNLLGNAVKFTDAGTVRLLIRAETAAGERRLVFEIIDTGIGLSTEQLAALFQPFTQADASTTRKFGGTGLGLVISRRLARILGGDISVRSTLGQGSRFTFSIPLREPPPPPIPAVSPRIPSPIAAAASAAPMRGSILFAEDGRDNQILISHVLRRAGAAVTLADNGRGAVDMALAAHDAGQPFDLILMDMQMPEMDGYDATRLLREKGLRIPIIALTASAMAEDRARCLDAGCDDFATKPIDVPALLSILRANITPRNNPP